MVARADTITEQSVIQSVYSHFPLVLAAEENIKKARAEFLSAQGAFDPTIRSNLLISPNGIYQYGNFGAEVSVPIENTGNKVFTGYRIGRGVYPVYDQNLETFNYGEVRAGFEIPFLRGNAVDPRRTKINKADITTHLTTDSYRLEKLKAEYDASIAYWDWYTAGKQLLLQKHMLQLAQDRQVALDKSFHAGDVAELDAIDNKRTVMQRQSAVKMQEAIFAKASLMLSLYYRDASGHPIVASLNNIPGQVNLNQPVFDKKILANMNNIINQHPGVKVFQAQYSSSLEDLKQGNNDLLPRINNRFYVAQDFGGGNPPLNKTTINYELTFELPINQREAKGQIEAAKKQMEKIDQERQLQAEQIAVNIEKSLVQIQATRKIIDFTRQETEMAAKVERGENIRYRNGDSNLFLLNQRELMTVEAESRYLDAIKNYKNAIAILRFSLGNIA
jgi:outer membrane protein TolC